jgi:hypothetical protein
MGVRKMASRADYLQEPATTGRLQKEIGLPQRGVGRFEAAA